MFARRTLMPWLVCALLISAGSVAFADAVRFAGVNLAGAEFGESHLPGTYNQDYTFPRTNEVDYFLSKGMNLIRLPFRWERLQGATNAALNPTELGRIQTVVNYAASKGAYVLLDPHNYARYYNTNLIGSAALPIAALTNFWGRVATVFRNQPQVFFGLMNEPHDMSTEVWRDAANGAIAAIRGTGATNLILVPGNAWTGAHNWEQSYYGTPNGTAMLGITDPGNNYAFEVHQYLDADSSGGGSTCVSASIGVQRLTGFTAWCRRNQRRGFLGEVGVPANTTCLAGMSNMLAYMNANADVWLGWAYWAAGPWWGNYPLSIEPVNGIDQSQTDVLQEAIPIPVPTLTLRKSRSDTAFIYGTRYGFKYQPETSFSLQPLSWTNFNNALTGGIPSITVFMQTTSNAHQFFRVKVDRLP